MTQPLILAYLRDAAARQAVRDADCDLLTVGSLPELLTVQPPRPPRLFVLQLKSREVPRGIELLARLAQERPLTDVVLWVPQAAGESVRALFHAGAKDVVVSRSASQLVDSLTETLRGQRILPRLSELGSRRHRDARFDAMWSRSEAMWDLFELCTQIAPAEVTVLIVGETGTGKELLARAVHRRSQRPGRFVTANCASIAPELVNSELFGHVKGAFTGADRAKKGLVAYADQGTLFLDEIGDMPPEAQQSLLRLLQEKLIRPVGSLGELRINVRIVAATNVPLDQAVREGRFREDLFYRLDVIRLSVPPLRERPEDILFLFGHFTKRLARQYGLEPPTFSDPFLDALVQYDWPGNVRQLENFTERLVLSRPRRALTAGDFRRLRDSNSVPARGPGRPERPAGSTGEVDLAKSLQENLVPVIDRLEREYLRTVLGQHAGRVTEAAHHAGISRRTLLRKMKLHEIDKKQFRP